MSILGARNYSMMPLVAVYVLCVTFLMPQRGAVFSTVSGCNAFSCSVWLQCLIVLVSGKGRCNHITKACTLSTLVSLYLNYFIVIDKYLNQFGGGSQYAYYHETDESSFHLVDTSRPQKPIYMRNRARFNQVCFNRD